MFQPIHLLPKPRNPDYDDIPTYQDRWYVGIGKENFKTVIKIIEEGGGKDIFERYHKASELQIMKSPCDLKGIELLNEDFNFPENNIHFDKTDFSYSLFWHAKFTNAIFNMTKFRFSRNRDCQFTECAFQECIWYGVEFESTTFNNCRFELGTLFVNCEFKSCTFNNCFIPGKIFIDCCFNSNTKILPSDYAKNETLYNKKEFLAEIYKGIKDSYLAGEVFDQYREYFYKQKSAETRHIKIGIKRVWGHVIEEITGYGVKWGRTFEFGVFAILFFSFIYIWADNSICVSLLMSASAFATMGDIPNLSAYSYIYVIESLIGISVLALFVTVVANVWFSEK